MEGLGLGFDWHEQGRMLLMSPPDGGPRQMLDGLLGSLLHALPSPRMLNGS